MSPPEITSHPGFRALSNEFFRPYPPYVLVNSDADAKAVLESGCEADYLVVLDSNAPEGTKSLSSDNTKQYRERIGILILTLPPLPSVSLYLSLLSTGGTMIGYASLDSAEAWKDACTQWAQSEQVKDTQGNEQDGVVIEWSSEDQGKDGWVAWSVVKKAPEWAFC